MQADQAEVWLRTFLDYRLFTVGDSVVRVSTVFILLLVLVAAYVASRGVQRAIRRLFRGRGVSDPGTVELVLRLVHYGIMALAIAVGLQTVGIELAALFAAGAIFAIAVGFAMQNIAENFVSGLILVGERSIKPGDVLEVGGQVVRVVRMGIRSTVARTRHDEDIIIPNSKLVGDTVKNFTLRDSIYRIRSKVGVVYGSDPRHVMDTLRRAADGLEWRERERPPQVVLTEFADSSVNFEVRVWIQDPWQATGLESALNEAVWYALAAEGITIAFPQLDVHLDRRDGPA
ncbi:MAG: mechanosensitive ion channel [Gemmatimonadota bacterium]|jgi:potassium efflux system protein